MWITGEKLSTRRIVDNFAMWIASALTVDNLGIYPQLFEAQNLIHIFGG